MENIDDETLDQKYIKDFELLESEYNGFYNEIVTTINLYYFYINDNNEIYHIKSELENLDNSSLTKERILYLIKKNLYNSSNKHKLVSLLKYNIDFDYTEINNFLTDKLPNKFLSSLKIVDTITFAKTISILKELNSVIFIFTNKNQLMHNTTTKNIHIKPNTNKTRRYKG
jgi:hypothetical protein